MFAFEATPNLKVFELPQGILTSNSNHWSPCRPPDLTCLIWFPNAAEPWCDPRGYSKSSRKLSNDNAVQNLNQTTADQHYLGESSLLERHCVYEDITGFELCSLKASKWTTNSEAGYRHLRLSRYCSYLLLRLHLIWRAFNFLRVSQS